MFEPEEITGTREIKWDIILSSFRGSLIILTKINDSNMKHDLLFHLPIQSVWSRAALCAAVNMFEINN